MTNKFLKYWIPLYIYAGLIFYLSSQSKVLPSIGIPNLDKVLHLCEYTVFGFLCARAFKNASRKLLWENFKAMAVLAALIYGISDEFHQLFVPGREFSMFDMLADGVGGVVGMFVYCMKSQCPPHPTLSPLGRGSR